MLYRCSSGEGGTESKMFLDHHIPELPDQPTAFLFSGAGRISKICRSAPSFIEGFRSSSQSGRKIDPDWIDYGQLLSAHGERIS